MKAWKYISLRICKRGLTNSYVAERAETREMLNSRYDDMKSGKVQPTDVEEFFESLRKRADELLNRQ